MKSTKRQFNKPGLRPLILGIDMQTQIGNYIVTIEIGENKALDFCFISYHSIYTNHLESLIELGELSTPGGRIHVVQPIMVEKIVEFAASQGYSVKVAA